LFPILLFFYFYFILYFLSEDREAATGGECRRAIAGPFQHHYQLYTQGPKRSISTTTGPTEHARFGDAIAHRTVQFGGVTTH